MHEPRQHSFAEIGGSAGLHAAIRPVLYPRLPTSVIYGYIAALVASYAVVLAHTPLAISADASRDDALFIALGRFLADGRWLGPFDQFTLAKGPGYPAFLALSHWLGTPLSVAHALFHCAAITFFVAVVHRFIRSLLLSGVLFALLLWHPISMTAFLLRPISDQIYYAQLLIMAACFICMLFDRDNRKRQLLMAALGGAILGWFWLTREEGAWIIPPLCLLVIGAAGRGLRERRSVVGALAIFFLVFAAAQVAFRAVNWMAYGKFVGVDTLESNFRGAVTELSSVRSGGTKPFVTITRAARERVYAISPAFASLAPYLENPAGWAKVGCDRIPSTCGEIGAASFVWALRDAAAAAGQYQSPTRASMFFGLIADDVRRGCLLRLLECSWQPIAGRLPTSFAEVAKLFRSQIRETYDLLTLRNVGSNLDPSTGSRQQLDADLRFLNYPLWIKPREPSAPRAADYITSGWYYKSGDAWLTVRVKDLDGSLASVRVDRQGSPDLQSAFNDPNAVRQRFTIRTRCHDECVVQFEGAAGATAQKRLSDLRMAPLGLQLGEGRLWVDRTEIAESPLAAEPRSETICNVVRNFVVSHYRFIYLAILILGVIAFLASTVLRWKDAARNVCYVVASASWMVAAIRAGLFILVELAYAAELQPSYLAPAYFFLLCGALFSCAACLQLFLPLPRSKMAPTQAVHI